LTTKHKNASKAISPLLPCTKKCNTHLHPQTIDPDVVLEVASKQQPHPQQQQQQQQQQHNRQAGLGSAPNNASGPLPHSQRLRRRRLRADERSTSEGIYRVQVN